MFDRQIYINRREELKKKFKSGLLVFLGNDEAPINYPANTYNFRQDSSFLYYFGLPVPNL
ncbi:MAG: aminopeptidase P N-terminal domain-containing protein, partial [Ignavibacterium sp.]